MLQKLFLNIISPSIVTGNLAFPLLLVGGLFLLSRRGGGGMGGPGGPGNPMAFGKSKAKFQMEPNTGITFGDVAGVDEAKQDFMEVSRCPSTLYHYMLLTHQGSRPITVAACGISISVTFLNHPKHVSSGFVMILVDCGVPQAP